MVTTPRTLTKTVSLVLYFALLLFQPATADVVVVVGRGVASGSPAWSESIAAGSTDTNNNSDSGTTLFGKVTAGQSGNVTKLSVYTGTGGLGVSDLKIALYDLSLNRLAFATLNGTGDLSDEWVEVTVSATAVTASTVYLVGFICEVSNDYTFRYLDGAPANSSLYSFSYNFTSFPPNPATTDGGLTRNYAVRIWIEP